MVLNISKMQIGVILIVFAIMLSILVWSLTERFNEEAHKTCPIPPEECPFQNTVPLQSAFLYVILIAQGIIGAYLIFSSRAEITATIERESKVSGIAQQLKGEEKSIYDVIVENKGAIFQSELVEKTDLSKVKITRILDRLEGKGLIERKRRGMSNIILLKH